MQESRIKQNIAALLTRTLTTLGTSEGSGACLESEEHLVSQGKGLQLQLRLLWSRGRIAHAFHHLLLW